ncbi:MAG: DNA methyltransferase [Promethearchaeota archaeon]
MNNDVKSKFKILLKELFRVGNNRLDFGIHRVLNFKRREIDDFIENDLFKEIDLELNELRAKAEASKDSEARFINDKAIGVFNLAALRKMEFSLYNHLITFFSRYFHDGDFIRKRKYGKDEKYIVPFNGDDVFFYWTNKEQYYVKSSEYPNHYSFIVGDIKVIFYLVRMLEEKGNTKSEKKKFFMLSDVAPTFKKEEKMLEVSLEYRPMNENEKIKFGTQRVQERIIKFMVRELEHRFGEDPMLASLFIKDNEGNAVIEKHISSCTRKSMKDFFIQLDLEGFLIKELDYYIKNEILKVGDNGFDDFIGNVSAFSTNFAISHVVSKIAKKIILFLSSIENFQKKLWEKKKFVIETNYVITLDYIGKHARESFMKEKIPVILRNEEQLKEWKGLFGEDVREISDLVKTKNLFGIEWKPLPIDTRYFSKGFTMELLAEISREYSLEDQLDGILMKSHNFHAINLLIEKYKQKIQAIYIDPPFNKEKEANYLYKVGYKDSAWITMLDNAIRSAKGLLKDSGSIFVRCDPNGNMYVRLLLDEIFGKQNFRNEIILQRSMQTRKAEKRLLNKTDSLFFYFKDHERGHLRILDQEKARVKCFKETLKALRPILDKGEHAKIKKKLLDSLWMPFLTMPSEQKTNKDRLVFGIRLSPPRGRHWAFSQENLDKALRKGIARLKCLECGNEITSEKGIKNGACSKCGSTKLEGQIYSLYNQVNNNWTDIPGYEQDPDFPTKNSEMLLKRVIKSTTKKGEFVMDFFLGSGTTVATAQKIGRKWIGIEMGEHFWSVVLPRLKKVLHHDKSGISRDKDVKAIYNKNRCGGFFKYHVIEQYEDSLENLEFNETPKSISELSDYKARYMLDWETRKSRCYLDLDLMENPFNYKIHVTENYKLRLQVVDLIETFNYCKGIKVCQVKIVDGKDRKYVFVLGRQRNKNILVAWRSIQNIDYEDDKKVINEIIKNFKPDRVYVNGKCIVERSEQVELELKGLMFNRSF